MTACPCGGVIDALGPVGFCRDCRSMIDLETLVVYPARPAPAPEPSLPFDIPALAEAFMDASRRLAARFDIHAMTTDGKPPAYEDLADNQREHLHAALESALRVALGKT